MQRIKGEPRPMTDAELKAYRANQPPDTRDVTAKFMGDPIPRPANGDVCPSCGRPLIMHYGITAAQKRALDFIKNYTLANDGISPSFEEIKQGIGLKSKSGVHRIVNGLADRGVLTYIRHHSRSIVILTGLAAGRVM